MRPEDINNESNLHFLDNMSDYKVASDDPDVRGWEVVDENNNSVGKVDNLLVDENAKKVRYIDVELDQSKLHDDHDAYAQGKSSGVHEYENREGEPHMIIPVGLARVDTDSNKVISDKITNNLIEGKNFHRKGELVKRDHEQSVISTLTNAEKRNTQDSKSESTERMTSRHNSITDRENPGTVSETKKHGDIQDREMRRPESSADTKLSQEARRSERVSDPENTASQQFTSEDKPYRDESWSFETHRNERLSRSSEARGPVQTNFYTHRYFDDNRFYGRS